MRFGAGPMVLQDVHLEVPAGAFHALIGPSGCGKSTLLRLAAGLLKPSSGSVTVDGVEGRQQVGFIFQEPRLLPWLSVRDNIALPMQLQRRSRLDRAARAAELAEQLELGDALEYYPRQLSGGMKMRVALARALTLSPGVMLLDEPLGALDAITRNRLHVDLLALHRREGWTGLLVTHSVNEAVFMADRVYVMSHHPGRIMRVFDIDLPRERGAEVRECAAYQAQVSQVMQALREVVEA